MIEEKFAYIKAKEVLLATLQIGIILERNKTIPSKDREKLEELNIHLTEIFMDEYMDLQPIYEPGEHSFSAGLRWNDEQKY